MRPIIQRRWLDYIEGIPKPDFNHQGSMAPYNRAMLADYKVDYLGRLLVARMRDLGV